VFLTFGGFLLLRQWGDISLADLARHDCIEHDASLVHDDTPAGAEYAPCKLNDVYLQMLGRDASDGSALTVRDLARARVRREHQCNRALDRVHSEIARGEMALVLGVFGRRGKTGSAREVPVETVSEWWKHERFPAGWVPREQQGLLNTIRTSREIKEAIGLEEAQWTEAAEASRYDINSHNLREIEMKLRMGPRKTI